MVKTWEYQVTRIDTRKQSQVITLTLIIGLPSVPRHYQKFCPCVTWLWKGQAPHWDGRQSLGRWLWEPRSPAANPKWGCGDGPCSCQLSPVLAVPQYLGRERHWCWTIPSWIDKSCKTWNKWLKVTDIRLLTYRSENEKKKKKKTYRYKGSIYIWQSGSMSIT